MTDSNESPRRNRVANSGSFAPGKTGNAHGRPRKKKRPITSPQARTDFLEELEREFSVAENGKQVKMPAIRWICRRLIQEAARGDVRCILKVIEMRHDRLKESNEVWLRAKRRLDQLEREVRENPEDVTDRELAIYRSLKAYVEDDSIAH